MAPVRLTPADIEAARLEFYAPRPHAVGVATCQRMLIAAGFGVGPYGPDGDPGPDTRAAFRRAEVAVYAPWYAEALRRMGLHETAHNRTLRDWLRLDGRTLGDPARLPWCGDLVETAVRLALPDEPVPENPYLARNWLRFGQQAVVFADGRVPLGAVAVFWRGSRTGISGHVGFAAGYSADRRLVYVLGGNQSNRVSIAPLSADRLLGFRYPTTAHGSPVVAPTRAGGTVSTNEA